MISFTIVQSSVLALDDSVLDGDQVDNLIKFCPTKEEMELLKVNLHYLIAFDTQIISYFWLCHAS